MASTDLTRAEIEAIDEEEKVAEAIAAAVGSGAFARPYYDGERIEARNEWRELARKAIALHRAQQA